MKQPTLESILRSRRFRTFGYECTYEGRDRCMNGTGRRRISQRTMGKYEQVLFDPREMVVELS